MPERVSVRASVSVCKGVRTCWRIIGVRSGVRLGQPEGTGQGSRVSGRYRSQNCLQAVIRRGKGSMIVKRKEWCVRIIDSCICIKVPMYGELKTSGTK